MSATDPTEQINPLTGDLITVTISKKDAPGGTIDVQGRLIAPGLAITPDQDTPADKPPRFGVTHVPSGLRVGKPCCGKHVQDIAAIATTADIDWTAGQEAVVAAIKAVDGLPKQLNYWCDDWCEGDGQRPPIWEVRCNTCDWQLDGSEDEPALSAEDAKRAAQYHECEPDLEIRHPETSKWHEEWLVNKDGSVRDLIRKG